MWAMSSFCYLLLYSFHDVNFIKYDLFLDRLIRMGWTVFIDYNSLHVRSCY
jgi:hypothetical protein